jgi:hypothetical protein
MFTFGQIFKTGAHYYSSHSFLRAQNSLISIGIYQKAFNVVFSGRHSIKDFSLSTCAQNSFLQGRATKEDGCTGMGGE